ncbi:MAG: YihY/virulence factor BrkB family protein [Victivallales bacterium]|nr:YihY/virulence factor BrkB family protein [Victivallales bacterium]
MDTPKKNRLMATYQDAKRFFEEELWTRDVATLPALRRAFFAFCRVVMIVIRGFNEDNCSLQASALTYITLVSLVPMLAIMFSFSKGLGMERKILENIGVEKIRVINAAGERGWRFRVIGTEAPLAEGERAILPEQATEAPTLAPGLVSNLPQPMQEALIKVLVYVENTSFAALGLVGSLMLLFSVVASMAKLEKTMNSIWGVKQARPWLRKISDYLVVLILVPIVFLVATSMNTVLLSNQFVEHLRQNYGTVAALIEFMVKVIGSLFLLGGFALFYMLMPNTKVKAFPALVSGLIAAILWFGVQLAYLKLQVGLTNFNTIYGTFAVVPFFLAWIFANWSIILFGAEVGFAIQNHRTIHNEKASERASTGVCIVIGNLILFEICRHFKRGGGAWNPEEYAQEHSIPSRVLQHVVDVLVGGRLIVKIQETGELDSYVPGRSLDDLSPADVEEAFRETQSLDTKVYLRDLPQELRDYSTSSYQEYRQNLAKLNYGALVSQAIAKEKA